MSQSAYSEEIADLLRQAEETFAGGDPESARMIFEAVLQIDPENETAMAGVDRALPPPAAAPSGKPIGDFDLPLDFDLAAVATPAPAPASPSPLQSEAIEDLLEATGQLPVEEAEKLATPRSAAVRAVEGEAALLAEQARRHLFQGDLPGATELASRALAMHESCEAAQEVLEEARAEAGRRAATVDHLLSDAIASIERGDAAQAIPMLQQVLGLAPEHPEALEWLARARQLIQEGRAHNAATAETGPALGGLVPAPGPPAPASKSSATVPRPAAPLPSPAEFAPTGGFDFQSNATPEPAQPSAGRYAAGVAKERVPVDAPLAAMASAKPVRPPIAVAGAPAADAAAGETAAPAPPAASAPPLPTPRANAPAVARPLIGNAARAAKGAKSAKGSIVRRLAVPVAALFALVLLGSGGWWLGGALGWWGGGAAQPAVAEQKFKPAKALKAAPAPAAPQLTKADVPRLLTEAKLAVARGDEQAGFALIRQAAQLDPAHAEAKALAAKVEHAIASRAEADDRRSQLVRSYNEQDFSEALRILYRLPKSEQPADFNRAIANASFNLGLQLMRGGDPYGAREYLRDALERRPGDSEVKRLLELGKQYRDRARDEAYYQVLGAIPFRPLE